MNIVEIAEFVSAFAALMTVSLATIELSARSKTKKAEDAISIYSDYLHIKQQLDYYVNSTHTFTDNISKYEAIELCTFAQTHIIPKSLFDMVCNIEKQSICNFDYSSKSGKSNSTHILNFSSQTNNLMISVNTFYKAYLNDPNCSAESISNNQAHIDDLYKEAYDTVEQTGEMLRGNLKKLHNHSNTYLAFLFLAGLFFLAACFIL